MNTELSMIKQEPEKEISDDEVEKIWEWEEGKDTLSIAGITITPSEI